jgi:hypothetical protein
VTERIAIMASSYPLFDIFLTTLYIVLFIFWIMLVFQIMVDIFRSQDMGGAIKALWIFFIIFLPFLGVLVYLIARRWWDAPSARPCRPRPSRRPSRSTSVALPPRRTSSLSFG